MSIDIEKQLLELALLDVKQSFFNNELKKFLVLTLSLDGVGRKTVKKVLWFLIKHELKFSDFWVNKLGVWQKCRLSKVAISSVQKYKKEQKNYSIYNQAISKDIRIVTFWEKEYPSLLKQTSDFPVLLFVKGNLEALNSRLLAVVGTRKMSKYGAWATKKITKELVLASFGIVSGFMYGVDITAHLEAVKSGGITVAVLGFGFNYMYPRRHREYVNTILKSGGCFVSEFLPNTKPSRENFPLRNRIVAGMSEAVIVVEAGKKSGTHITAECAIDEGREVFAVSGPINNPYCEGTKWLINQGAVMISSGEDVVKELGR